MVLPGVPGYVNIASKASKYSRLVIRLQQWGCSNRPFYHVVVDKVSHPNRKQIDYIEQVGTYDPMVNAHNEKLCALNLERIQSYIAGGVQVTTMDMIMTIHISKASFLSVRPSVHLCVIPL